MAELVTSTAMIVTATDIAKLQSLATYDAAKVTDKGATKELALTKKVSPTTGKYWRLVYKDKTKEALFMFEDEGQTLTAWNLYCGTKEECLAEVKKIGLKQGGIGATEAPVKEGK